MIFFTENAMELEANSISQMFISAKANSVELNFYKADFDKGELSASLAIRARKRNNFKRKRSP